MFNWLWKKKKPQTPQIQTVVNLLFPDATSEVLSDGTVIQIDRSIDNNLEHVLISLETGNNDKETQRILRAAINNLVAVRQALEIRQVMDSRAKYIIFDIPSKNIEEVRVDDE